MLVAGLSGHCIFDTVMYSIVFQVAEIQNQHLEDWEENLYDPQSESNEEAEQASGMDSKFFILRTLSPTTMHRSLCNMCY